MNSKLLFLIVFGMLVITAACAPAQTETRIEDATNTEIEGPASEGIQMQQEGIGPLEITPPPPGGDHNLAPSTDGDGGNINSKGERTTGAASDGEPGMVESKSPSGLTLEGEISAAVDWLTYQDQIFQFSIDYPQSYTILPDEDISSGSEPGSVQNLRFLDRQLADGATADLEIPNFTIEVYDLGNHTLETFLEGNFERGERETIKLGDLIGIRVSFNQLIAPNEFYYFSDHGFVYQLTPMGLYSQEMLETFQIH
jgi:hypothetical protein